MTTAPHPPPFKHPPPPTAHARPKARLPPPPPGPQIRKYPNKRPLEDGTEQKPIDRAHCPIPWVRTPGRRKRWSTDGVVTLWRGMEDAIPSGGLPRSGSGRDGVRRCRAHPTCPLTHSHTIGDGWDELIGGGAVIARQLSPGVGAYLGGLPPFLLSPVWEIIPALSSVSLVSPPPPTGSFCLPVLWTTCVTTPHGCRVNGEFLCQSPMV